MGLSVNNAVLMFSQWSTAAVHKIGLVIRLGGINQFVILPELPNQKRFNLQQLTRQDHKQFLTNLGLHDLGMHVIDVGHLFGIGGRCSMK